MTPPRFLLDGRIGALGAKDALIPLRTLTLYENQRASISIVNCVAYVSRFEVRCSEGAWVADPVIETLLPGFKLDLRVRSAGDDRVCLVWLVQVSEAPRPFREREVALGTNRGAGSPLRNFTVQLPEEIRTQFTGRTLLTAGEEVPLLVMPAGAAGRVEATVRVHRLSLPAPEEGEGPRDFPSGEGAGSSLLSWASELPASVADGPLEIALVALPAGAPVPSSHLSLGAAKELIAAVGSTPLARFRVNAALEEGVRVSHQLRKTYAQDFDLETGNSWCLRGPIPGVIEAGLRAEVVAVDGGLCLDWKYVSLRGMETFTTEFCGAPVTIELPETAERRGRLPLRSPVNVAPVGTLEDGRRLVLVATTGGYFSGLRRSE